MSENNVIKVDFRNVSARVQQRRSQHNDRRNTVLLNQHRQIPISVAREISERAWLPMNAPSVMRAHKETLLANTWLYGNVGPQQKYKPKSPTTWREFFKSLIL